MSASSIEQWHDPYAAPPLSLSSGVLRASRDQAILEENDAGLKLVLLLGGELRYAMHRRQQVHVAGPALHLSLSPRPFVVSHYFNTVAPLQYVAIRMPQSALRQQLGLEADAFAARQRGAAAPFFLDRRADKAVQALGMQLLRCPLQGGLRKMYMAGKALELTAAALAALEPARAGLAGSGALALPARQRECLHHARALLRDQLQDPPGLPALARQVGLNVTALTRGFRQLFGCSVYDFVREQRFEHAYRMLASGQCTVAQAAFACGYSDSHFSKAFQKRFGVAPRKLRG